MALPIVRSINDAIDAKVKEQRSFLEAFGPNITDIDGHNKAAERLRGIESQKLDWNDISPLAPNPSMYEVIEKAIEAADCMTEEERSQLREAIGEQMSELHEWLFSRRLRHRERWFAKDLE